VPVRTSRDAVKEGKISMATRIADVLVDVLAETGVRRIYGLPGDSLNEAQFRAGNVSI
jgi:hypothetical protein